MIPSLRNILLPTILVVAVLIPDVLSADVIRLRHSVRRSAADQPIRLGDIAILEGPQAEALSRTVIRPANARDATDLIRIRVAEVAPRRRGLLGNVGSRGGHDTGSTAGPEPSSLWP
jgi:hypothetical protein